MKPIYDTPEAARTALIETAIEVFAEKGYSCTKLQDIADRAGLSRGPLYYYFSNKHELFVAAMESICSSRAAVYQGMFRQDKHILELIREALLLGARGIKGGASLLISATPDMPAEAREMLDECYRTVHAIKTEAVERAIERVELQEGTKVKSIVDFMFILYEGMRAMVVDKRMPLSPEEIDELIDACMNMFEVQYCPG